MKNNIARLCLVSSLVSAAIIIPQKNYAQEENPQILAQIPTPVLPLEGIEDLQVNTPALTIINGNESALERPQTPKAFGLSLVNSFNGSDVAIPNIAIEVSPYWWSSQPKLSYEKYLSKTGFGESITQSLSFSIAADSTEMLLDGEMVDSTVIGVGLSFNLLPGKVNERVDENIQALRDSGKQCLMEFKEFIKKGGDPNAFICSSQEKDIELLSELESLDNRRTGLGLSIASAAAFDVPGNNFDNFDFSRFSTWLTASYQPTMKKLGEKEIKVPHPLN